MNLVKLDAALKKIVVLEGTKANYMLILAGKIVVHTTMEYLHNFQDRTIEAGHTCVLVGMERFRGLSDHAMAYRIKATESAIVSHDNAWVVQKYQAGRAHDVVWQQVQYAGDDLFHLSRNFRPSGRKLCVDFLGELGHTAKLQSPRRHSKRYRSE